MFIGITSLDHLQQFTAKGLIRVLRNFNNTVKNLCKKSKIKGQIESKNNIETYSVIEIMERK